MNKEKSLFTKFFTGKPIFFRGEPQILSLQGSEEMVSPQAGGGKAGTDIKCNSPMSGQNGDWLAKKLDSHVDRSHMHSFFKQNIK